MAHLVKTEFVGARNALSLCLWLAEWAVSRGDCWEINTAGQLLSREWWRWAAQKARELTFMCILVHNWSFPSGLHCWSSSINTQANPLDQTQGLLRDWLFDNYGRFRPCSGQTSLSIHISESRVATPRDWQFLRHRTRLSIVAKAVSTESEKCQGTSTGESNYDRRVCLQS